MLSNNYSSIFKDIRDRTNDGERINKLENGRTSSHVGINVHRTNDIMKLRDNDISPLAINGQPTSRQRRATSNLDLHLINSSNDVSAYDTLPGLQANNHSSDAQSLSHKMHSSISLRRKPENRRPMPQLTGSASAASSRARSASRTLLDERGSTRFYDTKGAHHSRDNNNLLFHSPRIEDQVKTPAATQSISSSYDKQ
ncbi:unnamed protein product [Rotaria sp. Silwood2]|nr:unnamed protein product [Rotaria sp. Silwood2]